MEEEVSCCIIRRLSRLELRWISQASANEIERGPEEAKSSDMAKENCECNVIGTYKVIYIM